MCSGNDKSEDRLDREIPVVPGPCFVNVDLESPAGGSGGSEVGPEKGL